MNRYTLPSGAIANEIRYFGPWYGGKPSVAIPFGERPSKEQVKAVGDVLAQIVKNSSTIPQEVKPIVLTTPETGHETAIENREYEYGFEVKTAGETNPILHLPTYNVYLTRGGEGFVQGAQGVVVIFVKNKSCTHCVNSLEHILSLLKTNLSYPEEMLSTPPTH